MANIKNFGLVGVGADVQFGKSGPRLKNDAGVFKFRNAADSAFVDVVAGNVTADALKDQAGKIVTVTAGGQLSLDSKLASDLATSASVATLQGEVDAIETAAGLGTDGTYAAETTSNYLNAATSLKNADFLLDAALKALDTATDTRLDALEAKASVDTAALQAEIDAIETAVGLDADGLFVAPTSTNYIDAATSVMDMASLLDAAIKARADAIAAEVTRATAEEADIRADFAAADSALESTLRGEMQAAIAGLTWENPVEDMVADTTARDALSLTTGQRVYVAADNKVYTKTAEGWDAGEVMVEGAAFFNRADTISYVHNGTEMIQFNGATGLVGGLGLVMEGNVLNVELSTDGGLKFYPDASNPNNTLGLKLDGTSLTVGATGLKLSDTLTTEITALRTDLGTETTDRTAADAALQSELDATQAGAGLSAAGAYVAETTSNYINAATSLKSADFLLDAAIKEVADDLAALGTGSLTALQAEVDAIEAGLGFAADGSKAFWANGNYFVAGSDAVIGSGTAEEPEFPAVAADTVKVAIEKLDAALKAADTAYKAADTALQTELNATQAGVGLGTDGAFVAFSGTNFMDAATSIVTSLTALDTALKAEETARAAAISALGTMSTQDADDVAITGGVIDGTVIGGTTAAAGTFTTLASTGLSTLAQAEVSDLTAGGMVFAGTAGRLTTDAGISYNAATDTLTVVGNIVVADPTLATHAATKGYVDTEIANAVAAGVEHAARGFVVAFNDNTVALPTFEGYITRIKLAITTAGTVEIAGVVGAGDVDETSTGIYIIEAAYDNTAGAAMSLVATGAVGLAFVEYLTA